MAPLASWSLAFRRSLFLCLSVLWPEPTSRRASASPMVVVLPSITQVPCIGESGWSVQRPYPKASKLSGSRGDGLVKGGGDASVRLVARKGERGQRVSS